MANLRQASPTKIYRLTSKGPAAMWIAYAVLVAAILLLPLQPFGRGVVPTFAVFGSMFVVPMALIVWRLKEPHARIQTDDRGIAQFNAANQEVCTFDWTKITSYAALSDPLNGKVMVVRGPSCEISFPLSVRGFTRLNNTIIQHLQPGITATNADLRTLLPTTTLIPKGSRRFGRFGLLSMGAFAAVGVPLAWIAWSRPPSGRTPLTTNGMYFLCGLLLLFGLSGVVAAINERYIVTSDGITYYNWLRGKMVQIAWTDVVALEFKRQTHFTRGKIYYYYTLLGKNNHINLDTMITDWDDLAHIIATHALPNATIELGPTRLPLQ